jgi:hypothetical protein
MGAVEVTFKYNVVNPKRTSFILHKVVDVVEWCPKDKPDNKYLFPKTISLWPSTKDWEDGSTRGGRRVETYILREGELLELDYSTGTWGHVHHAERALLIARHGSGAELDGLEVVNAEAIYRAGDKKLTLIAHKSLIDQGYLISNNKPISNAIAFYARQVLNKSINIPQMPDPELAEASSELREKLKSLMETLLSQ